MHAIHRTVLGLFAKDPIGPHHRSAMQGSAGSGDSLMIVVVGGAGYIGGVVTEELVRRGYDAAVVDNLSTGHARAVPDEVVLYEADMADAATIESLAENHDVEAVMHFAALALVGESTRQPARYWEQNVLKSVRMFERWIEAGVNRFIFSSTAAVYGEPESIPIDETHPTVPINPYGRTKRSVEWYLEDRRRSEDVASVSLRYFNAAGAGESTGEDHDPETHLIPSILRSLTDEESVFELYGDDYDTRDGTCLRDFVHVLDLADAHVRALERIDELGCERINLGTATGHTVREVVEAVQDVTGLQVPVQVADRRSGDPARLVASHEKAKRLLDWEPERDLATIVEDAWRWHRGDSSP